MLLLSKIELLYKQLLKIFKKLALVSGTCMPVIEVSKEGDIAVDWIPCIYYLIWFKKNKIQALIDFGSKFNVMTPAYASKLSFRVCQTNVRA